MKRTKLIITLLTILALPTLSLAINGGRDGGGGNSVVCFENENIKQIVERCYLDGSTGKISAEQFQACTDDWHKKFSGKVKSIELLDLSEIRRPRGFKKYQVGVLEAKPDENPYQYVDRVQKRFNSHISGVWVFINEAAKLIPESQIIWTKKPIEKVDDIGISSFETPAQCTVMTMMKQIDQSKLTFLSIDEWLYSHDAHSDTSKGVSLLHEMTYAKLRRHLDDQTSLLTRQVLDKLISVIDKNKITSESVAPTGLILMSISDYFIDHQIYKTLNITSDQEVTKIMFSPEVDTLRDKILNEMFDVDDQVLKNGSTIRDFSARVLNLYINIIGYTLAEFDERTNSVCNVDNSKYSPYDCINYFKVPNIHLEQRLTLGKLTKVEFEIRSKLLAEYINHANLDYGKLMAAEIEQKTKLFLNNQARQQLLAFGIYPNYISGILKLYSEINAGLLGMGPFELLDLQKFIPAKVKRDQDKLYGQTLTKSSYLTGLGYSLKTSPVP